MARALILEPDWLVVEGLGDWEADRGEGIAWRQLRQVHEHGKMACAICLPRKNRGFEDWFVDHGGLIVRYNQVEAEKVSRSPL